MKPYPFQADLLAAVKKGWAEYRKQLVVAPTGAGKGKCLSWMAETELKAGNKTLILVDQNELVHQTIRQLKETVGIDGQVEQADLRASKMCSVVVATVQSLFRRLPNWPSDHFGLVVADEADKSLSTTWQTTLKHFDGTARVCGYTATPMRSDKRSLGEYYENIAYEIGLLDVIKLGYLSPICVQMAPLKIDLSSVHTKEGDFDTSELDHAITPYLSSAVDALKQFALNRKTLVFLPLIRTSEAFVKLCREAGLSAEHIDGTSEDRAEKLARFKRNEFSVMANSQLLSRGYDDPKIDCVFILRPTKSESLFKQFVGRGTRIAPGKKNLLLIDCLWQMEKHMVCRPASLIATTPEEVEQITELSEASSEPEELLSLAAEATHEREEALAKKLAGLADRKAKYISAEEFAVKHHNMVIAEYEPVMQWERTPVTEKQAKFIEQAGIDPATVKGKGHASKILDTYFKYKAMMPATSGQKWVMRKAGWTSKDGMRNASEATAGEARDFFASKRAA